MDYYDKFKALSDPIRLDILNELNNGELSAGDIADKFALSNSKISYHLAILKKVDMVTERKYKNFIFYSLNRNGIQEASTWFDRFQK
ncbi:ArsR family transcriptional regulator [Streptococcus sp. HMSC057E02]|uniref:metalloregulator ArsR/SmtB family transcription factor n=1 Tax=Streptococcus sp. HMSC057E02 TaxID=1739265 RepID=UPI0008A19F43|nr:metalloregulator ArsR/SmtB family transcription factor [Streptococcus sp. HMSC057E02]OFL57337.1 ArsR family transcriptional regulator [Streptococcus sp. HMSC057E02]